MPDEEMGCGCGCQDCECKEINVCDTTERVHADLRDKLMVFADYVCTIALTPCSQLGKVMSKVIYYLWCMLKDLVNMIINNRKRTETLMENDEYFCDRMSAVSEWTINLSNTQARNHQKITKFIDDMASLGSKTKENGFLSEVAPQSFVMRGEPDATVKVSGRHITDEQYNSLTGRPGVVDDPWKDPSGVPFSSAVYKTTTSDKPVHLFAKQGDVIVTEYTNLKNSRLGDKKISKIKYTMTLIDLKGATDYASFTVYNDPASAFYISAHNNTYSGEAHFKVLFKPQFFDENGDEIVPSLDNPVLANLGSINSTNGVGEYISNFDGKLIPITGSSISIQNGVAMNFNEKPIQEHAEELGATSYWEQKGAGFEYVGAIVGQATQPIEVVVGNNAFTTMFFAFDSNIAVPIVEKPVLEPLPVLPYECNIKEFEC